MTISIKERTARRQSTVKPASQTREYVLRGVFDHAYAEAYALAGTPAIISGAAGLLFREDVKLKEEGFQVWSATVPYGPKKNETGQWTWDFDTTGANIHIKASKSTVNRYVPAGATAVDHKQLIGLHGDEVDGTDIVIPAMKINARFRHPQAVVTIPFAKQLARWTGKVNSDTFLTFSPGEVLFMGARGSDGSEAEAEVGYSFACEENLQNQVVGEITGIKKDGWDHIWLEWEDVEDANGKATKKPKQVNVERVYDRIPLAASLGFGS